jgi:hypothetical protein
MKNIKLLDLIKELSVGQGYSKYADGNKTSGNSKENLDAILKNIADGDMDYDEEINESTAPNIIFSIYNHILEQLRSREEDNGQRMSMFEELYPTASSFFQDIEHLLK